LVLDGWSQSHYSIIFVSDASDVTPFAVFSAVSGLELSLEKEQHKCRLILSLIACVYCFIAHGRMHMGQCFIYCRIVLVLVSFMYYALLYHAYEMLTATCLCADIELPVACAILICLFALQHYGTHKVGFLFAQSYAFGFST
jgi:K+ transporter